MQEPIVKDTQIPDNKISLVARGVKLIELLTYIEKNYNVNFSYSDNIISTRKIIYVSLRNESLETSLEKIFRNKGISFKRVGENIILYSSPLESQNLIISKEDSLYHKIKGKKRKSYIRKFKFKDLFFSKSKSEKSFERYAKQFYTRLPEKIIHADSLEGDTSATSKKNKISKLLNTKEYKDNFSELQISLMPQYSYRYISALNVPEAYLLQESKNNFEKGIFTLNASLGINYNFRKHFIAGVGISLGNIGYFYKSVKYINERDIPDEFKKNKDNRVVDEVLNSGQVISQYIGIPFHIGLRKNINNFRLNLSAGFSPLFLMWQAEKISSTTTTVIEVSPIAPGQSGSSQGKNKYKNLDDVVLVASQELNAEPRKRNSMLFFSAYVDYYLTSRFKVSAGPCYQIFLASVYPDETLIRQKPYSVGFILSLKYDLKK